jgi:dephospho-CoA kinase
VGRTGGIATVKSTVAAMLTELGAVLVDFDLLARQVVEPGQPAYHDIVEHFGSQVLDGQGNLERKLLAALVFGEPDRLKQLESFTHPRIFERFFAQLRAISSADPRAIVIADVPLLVEGNLGRLFDTVLVVYSTPPTQLGRLIARDGIDAEQAKRVIASQMPIDDKKAHADFLVVNEGDPEQTRAQVEAAWRRMLELAARGRGR